MYVGLENDDKLAVIDTLANKVIAMVPIGQAPQALTYVPNAVTVGDGTANLQPLGLAGEAAHLTLVSSTNANAKATSVSLFDQGLIQVVQAAVTGLAPKQPYVLALSTTADGSGVLQPVAAFMTNPAGSAIVDAVGPIRQIVQSEVADEKRYLVIASGTAAQPGAVMQVQER